MIKIFICVFRNIKGKPCKERQAACLALVLLENFKQISLFYVLKANNKRHNNYI